MSCHNLPHKDQCSTTKKDTTSTRKNFKTRNRGNKTKESKLSSDEEKTSSTNEESEIIDHIRNVKHRGVGSDKARSIQPQETTCTDNKAQESKEDEVIFERDAVSRRKDNFIAETERTQPRSNRVAKSIEVAEDDEDHRSVKKTELRRDNRYNERRGCGEDQLGNRRYNQYGRKKYNLRSRGHTNHDVDLQAVNAIEPKSSSLVKARDWNCISKPEPAVFHNYFYVLNDGQQYSQQIQFN